MTGFFMKGKPMGAESLKPIITDINNYGEYKKYMLNGETVYSFFNPYGMELKSLFDPKHMPSKTSFETVALFPSHAEMRNKPFKKDILQITGDPEQLKELSIIALDPNNYDLQLGIVNRRQYLKTLSTIMRDHLNKYPIQDDEIPIPILRCGGNIATFLKIPGCVPLEIKRLRFKDYPDILGAGVVALPEQLTNGNKKRFRAIEGIIASGSTIAALIIALQNRGIYNSVSCDAAVICPEGFQFLQRFRRISRNEGNDRTPFPCGVLNDIWYVIYHDEEPIIQKLGKNFIKKQVLGDGGDLTSNTE